MGVLVNDHTVMEIDALQVGERYFFSNVSVGISPKIIVTPSRRIRNSWVRWPTSWR